MRASQTLLPFGITVLLIGMAVASPIAADEIVTPWTTGVIPNAAIWSGDAGSLFSTVVFGGGSSYVYCPPGPYCGRYSETDRYRRGYDPTIDRDAFGFYERGRQTCVFTGYRYACYGPGKREE